MEEWKALSQAFGEVGRGITSKQVGVIVHGGGINVEAWEEEAALVENHHVIRESGFSRIMKVLPIQP